MLITLNDAGMHASQDGLELVSCFMELVSCFSQCFHGASGIQGVRVGLNLDRHLSQTHALTDTLLDTRVGLTLEDCKRTACTAFWRRASRRASESTGVHFVLSCQEACMACSLVARRACR